MASTSMSGRIATASEAALDHEREFLKSAKGLAHEQHLYATQPPVGSVFTSSPATYDPYIAHMAAMNVARTSAMAAMLKDPQDDVRGHAPMRAWGCRRVKPVDIVLPMDHTTRLPAHGRVNKTSVRTVAALPRSASAVDPVVRAAPKRSCGGHTFTLPYHKQYNYYKYYGNAGQNALSSQHHNFPNGHVPMPGQVYSAGAMAASSCVSARDRVHASEGYIQRYGTIAQPLTMQRDNLSQTAITAVHYDASRAASQQQRSMSGAMRPSTAAGNFGYGGGQRPALRAASAHGHYTTSAGVIGSRYGV